jgi:hypothetical protein
MKLLTAATVLSVVFSAAAYADEPRPLPKYFDDPMPSSPNARINWMLKARNESPLGISRVIHDSNAGTIVTYIQQPPR